MALSAWTVSDSFLFCLQRYRQAREPLPNRRDQHRDQLRHDPQQVRWHGEHRIEAIHQSQGKSRAILCGPICQTSWPSTAESASSEFLFRPRPSHVALLKTPSVNDVFVCYRLVWEAPPRTSPRDKDCTSIYFSSIYIEYAVWWPWHGVDRKCTELHALHISKRQSYGFDALYVMCWLVWQCRFWCKNTQSQCIRRCNLF